MRVGIDVSQSGSVDSGSVRLTVVYYLQSVAYGHSYSSVLHRSGAITGDVSVSFSSGYGATVTKEVARQTITVATAYGSTVTRSFSASLGPIWNGGAPKVTRSVTVAARQYEVPYTPTGVSATTTDGKTIRVSWSQRRDASHPVSASGIEYYNNQTKSWVRVGTVQGTGTAWSDTSLPAGRATYYRVWAWNGRESGRAQSATVWTTPTPATGLTAIKNSAGDIVVTWVKTVLHNEGSYDIYDNGTLIGAVGNNVTSFVHRAPDPAAAHTYTVVTKTPNGLRSAPSSPSPAVQVLGAPSAPTVLGPTGTVAPGRVVLSWRHNPTDSTAQTAARVELRRVVSPLVTELVQTIDVTGAAQTAAVTLPVGQYMWTVRTKGLYDGGAGGDSAAWSPAGGGLGQAAAQFRAATPPVVGITAPGPVVGAATTDVEWTYAQSEGHAQVSAVVELVELVDGVPSGPVETVSVSGAGTRVSMVSRLPHGSTWQVSVTVVSAVRQSATAVSVVSVVYPSPPVPLVDAVWDETTGAVQLAMVNPAPLPASARVVGLVPDPYMARPTAWATTGGALAAADGTADGWAQAAPVVPGWGCRVAVADPVPVSAGEHLAWGVDVAAGGVDAGLEVAYRWTADWWVNAETTKTATAISTSTSATSGNAGRIGTSTRDLPGGRTYRLALLVSAEADCYVDMGCYYMTTAGTYTRSLWPSGSRKQLSAGTSRATIWVDLPINFRDGEGKIQFICYLRAGGSPLTVHDAVVLDVTGQDAAPAEQAAPALTVAVAADGATAVLDGAAVVAAAGGDTVVVDGAVVSGDGATAVVDTTAPVPSAPASVPAAEEPTSGAVVSVEVEWLAADGSVLAVTSEPASTGTGLAGGGDRAVLVASVPEGAVAARPAVVCTGGTLWVRHPALTTAASEEGLVAEWWDPAGPYAMLGGQSYAVSADGSVLTPNSPPAARNRVARSVDGGESWELLDAEVPLDYATADPLALSSGETVYRVEAVTGDGASASALVAVQADSQAMWIGGGPTYSVTVPLYGNPAHSLAVDLAERDTVYLAGRRLPVEVAGIQEARSLSVSATLDDDDMPIQDTLATIAVLPGPVVYRDPLGRRMWCSMSGLSLPRDYRGGIWDIDLDLTEVDRDD